MSLHDPHWKYRTANETRQPGYLARRFKEIREEQEKERNGHEPATRPDDNPRPVLAP